MEHLHASLQKIAMPITGCTLKQAVQRDHSGAGRNVFVTHIKLSHWGMTGPCHPDDTVCLSPKEPLNAVWGSPQKIESSNDGTRMDPSRIPVRWARLGGSVSVLGFCRSFAMYRQAVESGRAGTARTYSFSRRLRVLSSV